jgi:hypothetical protein
VGGNCFCHPSSSYNFEVAPRFLENFSTPALHNDDLYDLCRSPGVSLVKCGG